MTTDESRTTIWSSVTACGLDLSYHDVLLVVVLQIQVFILSGLFVSEPSRMCLAIAADQSDSMVKWLFLRSL